MRHRLANPLPCMRIKNLRLPTRGANHQPPVLAKTRARIIVARLENQRGWSPRLHIPDLGRAVLRAGDYRLSVRIESQAGDRTFVLEWLTDRQPGKGIPQSN